MTTAAEDSSSVDGRLERRYRRLLALYPARYRGMFEEEMVGVAMSASKTTQRRSAIRESVSLISGALRMRLRVAANVLRDDVWTSAAAAYALFAAATMAVIYGHQLFGALRERFYHSDTFFSTSVIALSSGWILVAIAAALGRRRIAAIGAVLSVVGQAITIGVEYQYSPSMFVTNWWRIVLAGTAAAAAIIAMPPAGNGAAKDGRPLSKRAGIVLAIACAAPAVSAFVVNSLWFRPELFGMRWERVAAIGLNPVFAPLLAIAAATMITIAWRLGAPVRRRLLILVAPVVVMALVVVAGFGGFISSAVHHTSPIPLSGAQWIVLTTGPVVVLVAGMFWLQRYESRQDLVRADRAARSGANLE